MLLNMVENQMFHKIKLAGRPWTFSFAKFANSVASAVPKSNSDSSPPSETVGPSEGGASQKEADKPTNQRRRGNSNSPCVEFKNKPNNDR